MKMATGSLWPVRNRKRLDYCSIRNDCILVDYNDSIMY